MDLQTLEWISYAERIRALPQRPGVYLVALDKQIIYVGSANSVRNRLYCHERIKSHPEFARTLITFIPIADSQRDSLETGLIVLYRPELNRKHNIRNNGQFKRWSLLFTRAGTELAMG